MPKHGELLRTRIIVTMSIEIIAFPKDFQIFGIAQLRTAMN